jgi:dTDP-4-amino-4,6-dideoxygalactose transaminase
MHAEVLSLPMWPGMPADTVARVVDAVRQACASC